MTPPEQSTAERLTYYSFVIFLFTSTFSIAASQIALGLSLLGLLIEVITKKQKLFVSSLSYVYMGVAAWVAWLLLTAAINGSITSALYLCREEWLYSVLFIGLYLFRVESRRQSLMIVLATGVILNSIFGIVQYFTGISWFGNAEISIAPLFGYRVAGIFGSLITFGNYYAIATATILGYLLGGYKRLSRPARYLLPIAATLGALVTILSFGRASVATLAVTILILTLGLARRHWRITVGILTALILILLLVPGVAYRFVELTGTDFGGQHAGGRMFIWEHTLKLIGDNPILGVGSGNFKEVYTTYLPSWVHPVHRVGVAHNDFLHMAAISGLPGLFLYSLLWTMILSFLLIGYRRYRNQSSGDQRSCFLAALGGSICFLGISMYHGTYVDEEVRALLMFVWAIGLSDWYNQKKQSGRTLS